MAVNNITALPQGDFLSILFSAGVRIQISQDYRDWEAVKRVRDGNPEGREVRFQVQTSLAPASVQYRNATTRAFAPGQAIDTAEHIAKYKELSGTVTIPYNLWKRAQLDKKKAAEPLAQRIMSAAISSKRRLAADYYLDGTGVIGQVASVSDAAIGSGEIVVTLASTNTARGTVGAFEYGDLLLSKQASGAARSPSGGSNFSAYRVKDKNRIANTVTLQLVQVSDGVETVLTSYSASNLVAGDVFYRNGQPSFADLTAIGSNDYGTLTDVIPGLESLAASDGRVVHGLTMSGATAGSTYDAGDEVISFRHFQQALSQAKTRVGENGVCKWKQAVASPETFDAFIEANETDRRLQSIQDNTRGGSAFFYQHRQDKVELMTSEYCPAKRLWMVPEPTNKNEKVIEAHMTDFMPVLVPGSNSPYHLAPGSSGSHNRDINSYMEAYGTIVCRMPAAVVSIRNFKTEE